MRAFASRRQRHRGWVQRCVTPGAVELVIEASGMSVEPEHGFDDGHRGAALDAMRARILGMQRRVVDRLPGGLAFLAGLPSRSPLRIAVERRAQHRRAAWHLGLKSDRALPPRSSPTQFLETAN